MRKMFKKKKSNGTVVPKYDTGQNMTQNHDNEGVGISVITLH